MENFLTLIQESLWNQILTYVGMLLLVWFYRRYTVTVEYCEITINDLAERAASARRLLAFDQERVEPEACREWPGSP